MRSCGGAASPVAVEDVADDVTRDALLRGTDKVVHHGVVAIAHWQRLTHLFEPRDLLEPFAIGTDDSFVLDLLRLVSKKRESVAIAHPPPGFVAPEARHTRSRSLRHNSRVAPQCVAIDAVS